jgi:hypothetical protein
MRSAVSFVRAMGEGLAGGAGEVVGEGAIFEGLGEVVGCELEEAAFFGGAGLAKVEAGDDAEGGDGFGAGGGHGDDGVRC